MLIHRVASDDMTWHKDVASAPRVSAQVDLTLDDKQVLRSIQQLNFIQMKRKYRPQNQGAFIPVGKAVSGDCRTLAPNGLVALLQITRQIECHITQ